MGEGVKGGTVVFCGDLEAETGDCDLMFLAEDPEYGGLGGTGGHSNLPRESEMDGAPILTLSRLQLLNVALTLSGAERLGSLRGKVVSPI